MPLVIDRRTFLKASFAAGIAIRLTAAEPAPSRWALVSDIHCPEDPNDTYRGFHPQENLKTAAKDVAASDAEICVVCGDLARQTGNPGDYQAVKNLFRPVLDKMPVGLLLGNHDNRQNFQQAFAAPAGARQSITGKHVVTMEWADLRAVFLDSLLATNVTPGQLGSAQRQWLAGYLGGDSRPVYIFVHHDLGEEDGALTDAPRFLDLIAPLRQVKAVFYGHTHEYKFGVHHGIHLINLPATGYNFKDDQPTGWMTMTQSAKGANFVLRAQGGNMAQNGGATALAWR
jgi:3',5'-cyclic AMP phosphodiesterase CpdA